MRGEAPGQPRAHTRGPVTRARDAVAERFLWSALTVASDRWAARFTVVMLRGMGRDVPDELLDAAEGDSP